MNTLAAEIAQCLLIDCWNRTAALMFQLQPTNDSNSGSSPSRTQSSANRRHTSFRIADILADTNDDVKDDDGSDPRTVEHLKAERELTPDSTNAHVKPTRCGAKSAGFNCDSVPGLEGYAGHFRYGGRRFRRFSSSTVNSRGIISPLTALYRMTKDNFDITNANGQVVPPDFAEGGIDAVLQQCTELGKPGGLSSTRSRHHQPASEHFSPASTASTTNSAPEPALSAGSLGKKRRKSRTAFTGHQLRELERRFARQKYLLPADRDATARDLGLTNAQVITWFQNRRAKLKRDLDELRADVNAARNLLTDAPETGSSVADSSSVSVRSATSSTSNTSSVHSTEKGNVYGL